MDIRPVVVQTRVHGFSVGDCITRCHPTPSPSAAFAARWQTKINGRSEDQRPNRSRTRPYKPLQTILHQAIQAVEALTHVGCTRGQIDARRRAQGKQLQPLQNGDQLSQRRTVKAAIHFHSPAVRQQHRQHAWTFPDDNRRRDRRKFYRIDSPFLLLSYIAGLIFRIPNQNKALRRGPELFY
jgi:hypothetical protein